MLRDAVFAATLAEIADVGLRRASMDGIAHRAGTGKAALYRRWPNVRALAVDVLVGTMEAAMPAGVPDTGSLRGDLLASLTTLAAELNSDLGIVVREFVSEVAHDPQLSQEFQVGFGLRKEADAMALLQRAMRRGEIPHQQIDPYVLQITPALIVHQLILTGSAPTVTQVEHILDAIVLPLLNLPPAGLPGVDQAPDDRSSRVAT